jgi:hypothetical protein
MILSDYRDAYYELSGKASDVARQLAFAGIALIWIFHETGGKPIAIPHPLVWPAACFICGLAFDLLQYVSGALIWGAFHRHQEKRLGVDSKKTHSAPAWFNRPGILFFWGKLALVLAGYFLLLRYVVTVLQLD